MSRKYTGYCTCGCDVYCHVGSADPLRKPGGCRFCKDCTEFTWDGREPLRPALGRQLAYAYCTLPKWNGEPLTGVCHWCTAPLPPRRRSWCSDECADQYSGNHFWSFARARRLRLDNYTCQHCGIVGWHSIPHWVLDVSLTRYQPDHRTTLEHWAVALGILEPEQLREWPYKRWEDNYLARAKAVKHLPEGARLIFEAERYPHVPPARKRPELMLEVNHKEQVWGKHGVAGCHHHVDGLETLCRPCHKKVTAAQRKRKVDVPQSAASQVRLL